MDIEEFVTPDEEYVAPKVEDKSTTVGNKPGDVGIFSASWVFAFLFPFVGVSLSVYGLQLEKAKKRGYKRYLPPLIVAAAASTGWLIFLFYVMFRYFS